MLRGCVAVCCTTWLIAGPLACDPGDEGDCPTGTAWTGRYCLPGTPADPCDLDGDGSPAGDGCEPADCDPADPRVHPGAPETCNDRDDDCDGLTDEDFGRLWYPDLDADGHGDPAAAVPRCTLPPGHVATGDDCDDTDPDVAPGAPETCNARDDDCDGFTDEGAARRYYRDTDGDGFGLGSDFVDACAAPAGYAPAAFDCDDDDPDVHPDQLEFFDTPTADGGWDFDCDAVEERAVPGRLDACTDCTASAQGWLDAVPACGEPGTLLSCVFDAGDCAEASREEALQSCR